MTRKRKSLDAASLRLLAETRLSERKQDQGAGPGTKADLQRLLHELQVHQIELEIQNEELQRSRAELETVLRQYTDLYDFSLAGYFTLDRAGTIRQVNLTGARLIGIERGRLLNRHLSVFVSGESRMVFEAFLERLFESRAKETCEVTIVAERKEPLYLEFEARAVDEGDVCRAVAVDITARKRAEMELRFISIHDALTGLYNRGYFEGEMSRIERGRRFPVSVVMVDVDGLKTINDRQGHAAGDLLLKRVAQVLSAVFRGDDIVARIGGDEFAVLLPETGAKAAEDALYRVRRALEEEDSAEGGAPVRLSFGVSTADSPTPLADVLKAADEMMYLEKERRRAGSWGPSPPFHRG